MERRINTEAIHARGIFPGAQVVKGVMTGIGNSSGIVTNITCWCESNANLPFTFHGKLVKRHLSTGSWWRGGLLSCSKDSFLEKPYQRSLDHQVKDHWIRDQGFVLILLISVSGPNALCNHNCSICPQCSKAGSINSQCRITEFQLAYNKWQEKWAHTIHFPISSWVKVTLKST